MRNWQYILFVISGIAILVLVLVIFYYLLKYLLIFAAIGVVIYFIVRFFRSLFSPRSGKDKVSGASSRYAGNKRGSGYFEIKYPKSTEADSGYDADHDGGNIMVDADFVDLDGRQAGED